MQQSKPQHAYRHVVGFVLFVLFVPLSPWQPQTQSTLLAGQLGCRQAGRQAGGRHTKGL